MRPFNDLQTRVEGNLDDPFIKGTTIEVHRIAALLNGGLSVGDVMEAYPSLTAEQIEFSGEYAKVFRKKGRPYPATTFLRALGALDLRALDDEDCEAL